jgi:hypothetical protein
MIFDLDPLADGKRDDAWVVVFTSLVTALVVIVTAPFVVAGVVFYFVRTACSIGYAWAHRTAGRAKKLRDAWGQLP